MTTARHLAGAVTLLAGATGGAGRRIAVELGAAGRRHERGPRIEPLDFKSA